MSKLKTVGIVAAVIGGAAGAILIPTHENVQCVAHMTRGNIVAADMALKEAAEVAWSICENHR